MGVLKAQKKNSCEFLLGVDYSLLEGFNIEFCNEFIVGVFSGNEFSAILQEDSIDTFILFGFDHIAILIIEVGRCDLSFSDTNDVIDIDDTCDCLLI